VSVSQFAPNVLTFSRILRSAGLSVGTDRALHALDALRLTGIESRATVSAALAATLLASNDDRPMFDRAFALFWRDPDLQSTMRALLLPQVAGRAPQASQNRRLSAAFFPHAPSQGAAPARQAQRIEFDAALTFSAEERLRRADFETLSPEEFDAAKRLVARMTCDIAPVKTRRVAASRHQGPLDFKRSLGAAVRAGGDVWPLVFRQRVELAPPIVVLADISGSMERITRMLLYFLHSLAHRQGSRSSVETFLFGTRLTRVTRDMAHRDPDEAVSHLMRHVEDWSGGTRIGAALRRFNKDWARRVLGKRAVVLLVTDGLDRDDDGLLEIEAARLHRAAREVIWLNPLLRFAKFEAKAAGVRTLLPHVDRHVPLHNIESLAAFAEALSKRPSHRCPPWN
jgi:hypothetical protein